MPLLPHPFRLSYVHSASFQARLIVPPHSHVFAAGIPQIYHFGQEGVNNILVIDLLGPSLEDLFDFCDRKFSIETVCMAAKQMVRATQFLFYFEFCSTILVSID